MSPQIRPFARTRERPFAPRLPATAARVPLLALSLGCNALLDIEEATLCEGSGCDTMGPATSGQSAARVGSGSEATDAGAPGAAVGPPVVAASTAPGVVAPACATPAPDLARNCAACGGLVACDGRCSSSLPPDLGEPCGSCGGTITCNGSCSVMTPSDYGSILPRDVRDSFSCCFIDEVRSYGPDGPGSSGCYAGYVYDGCSVSKLSGYGSVSIVEEDAASCTCRVRVENQGLDGATYDVSVRLRRGCQPD